MKRIMLKRIIQGAAFLAVLFGLTQTTLAGEKVTRVSAGINNASIIDVSENFRFLLKRIDVEVELDAEGLLLDHAYLMKIDPSKIKSATIFLSSGTPDDTGDHQYVQFYYDDANTMVSGCHDIDNQQSCMGKCPCVGK